MSKLGPPGADRFHDCTEIDTRRQRHPGRCRRPCVVNRACRPQQGFRRHASGIEAIAAEPMAFDDRDPSAEAGGTGGADQACGSATNDDQVIERCRIRISPPLRTDLVDQPLVVAWHSYQLPATSYQLVAIVPPLVRPV